MQKADKRERVSNLQSGVQMLWHPIHHSLRYGTVTVGIMRCWLLSVLSFDYLFTLPYPIPKPRHTQCKVTPPVTLCLSCPGLMSWWLTEKTSQYFRWTSLPDKWPSPKGIAVMWRCRKRQKMWNGQKTEEIGRKKKSWLNYRCSNNQSLCIFLQSSTIGNVCWIIIKNLKQQPIKKRQADFSLHIFNIVSRLNP